MMLLETCFKANASRGSYRTGASALGRCLSYTESSFRGSRVYKGAIGENGVLGVTDGVGPDSQKASGSLLVNLTLTFGEGEMN